MHDKKALVQKGASGWTRWAGLELQGLASGQRGQSVAFRVWLTRHWVIQGVIWFAKWR